LTVLSPKGEVKVLTSQVAGQIFLCRKNVYGDDTAVKMSTRSEVLGRKHTFAARKSYNGETKFESNFLEEKKLRQWQEEKLYKNCIVS
jgi:hypothetical protein